VTDILLIGSGVHQPILRLLQPAGRNRQAPRHEHSDWHTGYHQGQEVPQDPLQGSPRPENRLFPEHSVRDAFSAQAPGARAGLARRGNALAGRAPSGQSHVRAGLQQGGGARVPAVPTPIPPPLSAPGESRRPWRHDRRGGGRRRRRHGPGVHSHRSDPRRPAGCGRHRDARRHQFDGGGGPRHHRSLLGPPPSGRLPAGQMGRHAARHARPAGEVRGARRGGRGRHGGGLRGPERVPGGGGGPAAAGPGAAGPAGRLLHAVRPELLLGEHAAAARPGPDSQLRAAGAGEVERGPVPECRVPTFLFLPRAQGGHVWVSTLNLT
jgi:hypothetical protein